MTQNRRRIGSFALASLTVAVGAALAAGGPSTRPALAQSAATTRPAPSAADVAISDALKKNAIALSQALPAHTIGDPAKRAAAAPTVIPLLKEQLDLYRQFADLHHVQPAMAHVMQRTRAELYLFGDADTVARVDADAKTDGEAGLTAQGTPLQARWIGAAQDAAAQQPVADDLVKLDAAHPESDALTLLTIDFTNTSATAALRQQMAETITKTMKSPLATRMAAAAERRKSGQAKLNGLVDKPLTIAETTVDGQPFSSEQYKGKVVLVDFWATWCGPCKAELPRVKELYGKYHDQGLEIVGVSNDYTAEALRKYTAENGMPWVELLDAPAAADHQWNPTTLGFGINGIPTMFLIDKKGVCRTVEARASMEELIPRLLAE